MDRSESYASKVLKKLSEEDYVHRGFMKPVQIALKTYRTETANMKSQQGRNMKQNSPFQNLYLDSLPLGLKLVVKNTISDNKFELENITEVEKPSLQSLRDLGQDNFLSLMKVKEGIQIAICVCMYSEDKKMLKSTLSGISENIANLVHNERIDPDKIGVFVIMDGIQKVDSSVVDYFQELERSHNIHLGQNIAPSLSVNEMIERAKTKSEQDINEQQLRNVNNFLFNIAELEDRNGRRFAKVKADYDQIKTLQSNIQTLYKKKVLFDELPGKIRSFFIKQARQLKIKQSINSKLDVDLITDEQIIEQYAFDLRKFPAIICKALRSCEIYCQQYLSSRDDLAYLVSYRKTIFAQAQRQHIQQAFSSNKLIPLQLEQDQEFDQGDDVKNLQTKMNLFMCVKYKNSGKLSSHNWFFNGFCKELQPKYAILLDVGLKPEGMALVKMYTHMKINQNIGGVCGYMSLKIERLEEQEEQKLDDVDILTKIFLNFTDIQRTQQVEYHFAHLMDKAFEASFGFIHVLPGAFSAYNMKAILKYDSTEDDQLLKSYFKSIEEKMASSKISKSQIDFGSLLLRVILPDMVNKFFLKIDKQSEQQMLYNQNIYLAEDRILCMGIHQKGYNMAFLPDAYAQVDPIKTVHGLLGQRKRWINGSFFAFQKVKKELSQDQQTKGCQFFLNIQILYLTLMNSMSYFSPAFFLFTVHIAMDAFRTEVLVAFFSKIIGDASPQNSEFLKAFVYSIDFIYVILIFSLIYYSLHLTNNNVRFKPFIYGVSTILGLFSLCVFIILMVDVIRGLTSSSNFVIAPIPSIDQLPGGQISIDAIRWLLVASILLYSMPICLYILLFNRFNVFVEIIGGALSFLFHGPTYLNILNIYSLCRIDDISWGTKGLDGGAGKNSQLAQSWKIIKYIHVSKYVIWNMAMGVFLLSVGADYEARFFITIVMIAIMFGTLFIKICFSLVYMIIYFVKSRGIYNRTAPLQTQYSEKNRLQTMIKYYKTEIKDEVWQYLKELESDYRATNFRQCGQSFIQISRKKQNVAKHFLRHKEAFLRQSSIGKSPMKKTLFQKRLNQAFINSINQDQFALEQANPLNNIRRKPILPPINIQKLTNIRTFNKKIPIQESPQTANQDSFAELQSQINENSCVADPKQQQ